MIDFEKALEKAKTFNKNLLVSVCSELKDSWIFGYSYTNGTPAFGIKPVRVMKDDGEAHEWDTMKHSKEFKEKFSREIELK